MIARWSLKSRGLSQPLLRIQISIFVPGLPRSRVTASSVLMFTVDSPILTILSCALIPAGRRCINDRDITVSRESRIEITIPKPPNSPLVDIRTSSKLSGVRAFNAGPTWKATRSLHTQYRGVQCLQRPYPAENQRHLEEPSLLPMADPDYRCELDLDHRQSPRPSVPVHLQGPPEQTFRSLNCCNKHLFREDSRWVYVMFFDVVDDAREGLVRCGSYSKSAAPTGTQRVVARRQLLVGQRIDLFKTWRSRLTANPNCNDQQIRES